MTILDTSIRPDIAVLPERECVRLRPLAPLDAKTSGHLEDEANQLIGRGFERLVIDLSGVETIGPVAAAALNAIGRHARLNGAQASLVTGRATVARRLWDAGLLSDLVLESTTEPLYFDWSR